MKKSIYKIENIINHKVYIGQTNNVKRRFSEHKARGYGNEGQKKLYRAFNKYGIENFTFSIIETDIENYDEKEQYRIKYYDSIENGYNISEGGEHPPVMCKEEHPMAVHTQKDIDNIIYLLKETSTSTKDIAKITGYNISSINRINLGELWHDDNIDYPIRKIQTAQGKAERAKSIIYDLLNTKLTQKEIAKKHGVGRTTVTAINNGQNHRDKNLSYPLR